MVSMNNLLTRNIKKLVAEPEDSQEHEAENVEQPVKSRRFNASEYVRERFYGEKVMPRLV